MYGVTETSTVTHDQGQISVQKPFSKLNLYNSDTLPVDEVAKIVEQFSVVTRNKIRPAKSAIL